MPRVRSALFVPGHRPEMLDRVERHGADAVIVDLEDAVAERHRGTAREVVSAWLNKLPSGGRPVPMVRINALEQDCLHDDLAAVVHDSLVCLVVPKVRSPKDVRRISEALAYHEGRRGLQPGVIRIWPLLETAAALVAVDEIANCSPRIAYLGGAGADGGDLARELGFRWTTDGMETLFLRSRVLLAARAAGVANPMTGLVTAIDDLVALTAFARRSRDLGYAGLMVIHPSHVAIVNEVFSPTEAELAWAARVMVAASGGGAIRLDGQMVDSAMVATATQLLANTDCSLTPTGDLGTASLPDLSPEEHPR